MRRRLFILGSLVLALVLVIAGARLLGDRADSSSSAEVEARLRAAGFPNRLTVVDMMSVPVTVSVSGIDPVQWGQSPPDDEPPAGLQGAVVPALSVGHTATLRPLRIVDGGGDATFTLAFSARHPDGVAVNIARVDARSSAVEVCYERCGEGMGWITWRDAPDPPLDSFRECVVVDRLVGSYVDASGARRDVFARFQCDAPRFQSWLVLHD